MDSNITRRARNSSSQESDTVTREQRSNENYRVSRVQNQSDEMIDGGSEQENVNQEKPYVRYRIGAVAGLLLGSLALFLDLVELVMDLGGTLLAGVGVVFGYIKDFFTLLIIPFMFFILGAPFWKGRKAKKKMIAIVTGFLISLIPWAGALLPETTISVLVTIYLTRKEDKEKAYQKNKNTKITREKRA